MTCTARRLSCSLHIFLFGLIPTATAAAALEWTVSTGPYLEARSTEHESDASLRAICRNAATVELRVGAQEQVGKGEGEKVALTFKSDGREAVVRGLSKWSDDSEMTGGTELVTEVKTSDPLFSVLQTGKAVRLSGSLAKPAIWEAKGMAPSVKKFLERCRAR